MRSNCKSALAPLPPAGSGTRRVGAAPAGIAPRQVPACRRRKFPRHEVEAGSSPGVASQQTRESHPAARPQAEAADGFARIVRAGWQMPTFRTDQRRNAVAIDRNQAARAAAGNLPKPDHRAALHLTKFHAYVLAAHSDFFTLDRIRSVIKFARGNCRSTEQVVDNHAGPNGRGGGLKGEG